MEGLLFAFLAGVLCGCLVSLPWDEIQRLKRGGR